MFKNIKIGTKITAVLLFVVLLSIIIVSFITYNMNRQSIEKLNFEKLMVRSTLKADNINSYFESIEANSNHISELLIIQSGVRKLQAEEDTTVNQDSLKAAVLFEMEGQLRKFIDNYPIHSILITNLSGEIIFNTTSNGDFAVGDNLEDLQPEFYATALHNSTFSKVITTESDKLILFGRPLIDDYNSPAGVLTIVKDMSPVLEIANSRSNDFETSESILTYQDEKKAYYVNSLRFVPDSIAPKSVDMESDIGTSVQNAAKGKVGFAKDIDYTGTPVLAAWTNIPALGWGLVSTVRESEIQQQFTELLKKFIYTGLILLFFTFIISLIFSKVLISPILSLKETLKLLGKGILPNNVPKNSEDEVGEMAVILDNFVSSLKGTANFAKQIGEGDFQADFKPISEEDTLGNSLINMRDSIQEAEKRDKERNWIVTGVAEIGEILRINDDLEQLGDQILGYVTKKIDAIQGAFYVLNDDDQDDYFIEMKSSYAYNKKKHLKARFKFAEGLVGQSAIEQDTLLRTEIPEDYVSITSGLLGDKRPNSILIVPLITNEKVYGVLEFAGFEKFNPSQVKFVEEISLIIARTVFNIKVNERTRKLLAESQTMSQELQEQQEVLRQNAEEMEATQEELKRTNQRLEDQIEEVNRTQKRMQLLLENASEVITIYEKDGMVRYISPSVEKILGYRQEDLIDTNDIDKVHQDSRDEVRRLFVQLVENPGESITTQHQYANSEGEYVWVEVTGSNQLEDPAIQGIIFNTRDITERRRAEQEERMRSKMQALSENSPDLITRIDSEGKFFYVNPMIESYTGKRPDEVIQLELNNSGIEPKIIEEWNKLLTYVKDNNSKITEEMNFPSSMGDRVMQVNAIPEYDEEMNLESVLMVSHDITERKAIELEIASKNKKITESINYAKRIQGSILPNNEVIRQKLPDSFILYKAKDVVSGDFPWYIEVDDVIYIAAVDCTGHGVPGALISLIGYFLLNDIVRSQKVSDPGIILDKLDAGVTATLRQDRDDSTTKDGMDIAFCKIDKKAGTIEYSGAHRPLYYLNANGELDEIKGNKFPIGGGIYRNQTNFENHKVKYKSGDSVFFCSDGFPDQFGGPENRKFGPKRLRELIVDNQSKSMDELHQVFDEAWENWKSDYKQTDDVLLIGIRF
ncbi:PAS domain S-box protein [Marivirga sp. S37H4]|uniref:PAS domain S-box protein n=1 Tax=Marivirga aurantiaca TaxID=2802615 RepID=A0A934WVE6_9BACT|nr:PAS domain S-box protein [Marivirga aurantiaca]MBK6263659.1 PAS domain S-box protein [Marivirga aurantiaca]